MNKAEEFHKKVLEELKNYTTEKVDKFFTGLEGKGSRELDYYKEVYRKWPHYPCYFYQYLACAVRLLCPRQIVEIGADMGVSSLMMYSEMPKNGTIYSVDTRIGWELVPDEIRNIIPKVGDSLDMSLWHNIKLEDTKLWLIDGTHTEEQVRLECLTYSPFWKPGTIVFFDDIDSYPDTWLKVEGYKWADKDVHGCGFGILAI